MERFAGEFELQQILWVIWARNEISDHGPLEKMQRRSGVNFGHGRNVRLATHPSTQSGSGCSVKIINASGHHVFSAQIGSVAVGWRIACKI